MWSCQCAWLCLVLLQVSIASPIITLTSEDQSKQIQNDAEILPWPSDMQRSDTNHHTRPKRQFNGGTIIEDIFQIPIATLNAISQLFFNTKKQRDKRRNPTANSNGNGYSTYDNGQNAVSNVQTPYNSGSSAYNNAQSAYNNGYNAYNNGQNAQNNAYNAYNYGQNSNNNAINAYNNGQTAYNNANNAYNNGQTAYSSASNLHAAYSNVNKPQATNNYPEFKPIGQFVNNYNSKPDSNIGANAFSSGNNNGYINSAYNRPFHFQTPDYLNNRVSRTHGAKVAQLSIAADGSSFKI